MAKQELLLTPEENDEAFKKRIARGDRDEVYPLKDEPLIRKDEREVILAWGNELCDCPTNSLAQTDRNKPVRKRKTCWKCWQALEGGK